MTRSELEDYQKSRDAETSFRACCTLGGAIGGGPIGAAAGAVIADVIIRTQWRTSDGDKGNGS